MRKDNLSPRQDNYSKEQEELHSKIKKLHDKDYSYKRISKYLNTEGIKTPRGKTFGIRPTLFLYCKYGLAVFNNEEEIIKIIPKLNVIKKLPYDGIIITAPGENVDFVSRFFAPKFGIPEDPVTGGAHCELIPYWSKRLNKKNMIAKQVSKRGGVIYCSYLGDRVIIGGKAITYMQGELLLGIKR